MIPKSDNKVNFPTIESQQKFWNSWNKTYREEQGLDIVSLRRAKSVLDIIEGLSLRSPRILEIGCANGWLSERLVKYGEVTAVDLADAVIEKAKKRVPQVNFYAGDFLEMKFDNSYEIVVSLETIAYVQNQEAFIRRVVDILEPKGYFILTGVNKYVFERRSDINSSAAAIARNWLTVKEFKSLLKPYFNIQFLTTIEPSGDKGLLRMVNSYKLNKLINTFISSDKLTKYKEQLGFGQTVIVLAQKK